MAFKPIHSRSSSFLSRTPGLGSPRLSSDPSFLGENLAVVMIPPSVGHPPGIMGLDYTSLCPLPISFHWGSFFIPLVVDSLFWRVLVFFIDGCSVNSCNLRGSVTSGSSYLFVFLPTPPVDFQLSLDYSQYPIQCKRSVNNFPEQSKCKFCSLEHSGFQGDYITSIVG